MAFNKLKSKLSELAGNETLGSADIAEDAKVDNEKPKEKKGKSKKAVRSEKKVVRHDANPNKDFGDVLSILGISSESKIEAAFTADDLDYIQFTQTTPLGFDFDEVADFIARTKTVLNTYERALAERDKDVQKLAEEVHKIEQRMVEQKQEEQLNLMMGEVSEEERLLQENVELKIELEELQKKLRLASSNSKGTSKLNKEIEALRAENEVLRRSQAQYTEIEDRVIDQSLPEFPPIGKTETPKPTSKMPSLDILDEQQDLLDEFMNDDNEASDLSDDPIDEMLFNIKEEFK